MVREKSTYSYTFFNGQIFHVVNLVKKLFQLSLFLTVRRHKKLPSKIQGYLIALTDYFLLSYASKC